MSGQPVEFFHEMREGFGRILGHEAATGTAAAITLAESAFDWFEGNIDAQTESQPQTACTKGCPTCCTLRVTATAPEVFLMAHYIRMVEATPQGEQLQLTRRIVLAEEATRGRSEQERLTSGRPCPMLIDGACILHPVRTLACRGHAAFSEEQCRAAASGEDIEVGVSEPHLTLRALVQSALQAALRDRGLPWGLYELNQALALTLAEPDLIDEWFDGTDGLAPAAVEIDLGALGQAFDELRTIN
ncbi:hypothetical protein [Novosphingobium album (ex Hu et al. 2023)]|uniref:YkgJ family cysteine cluster protein n=1 Tax=Novosphingobium album (ex Hu et al. 2023) TaxID=2930093 RepID=A0ABT0AYE9_9SPHN|nr:hypothetical protein [Novosphingobium album (ex Hu et al. 2023)]MCJ2177801.1 hypothetical protein [Novosphingobium album (ex Hu et al. 2023)]